MSGLRLFVVVLALLSSGLAQASIPFGDAPRASDEELDRMRGGFIVNLSGMEFLMAFSIDRLSYINGELVSAIRINPLALTPLTQIGQAIAALSPAATQTITLPVTKGDAPAAALDAALPSAPLLPAAPPPVAAPITAPPVDAPAATNAGPVEIAQAPAQQTPTQTTSGPEANPPPSAPAAAPAVQAAATVANPDTQVTTQGSLTLIQNGVGNAVALPANLDLSSLTTIIQNTLNDQVIRNITSMNITIAAQALAAQARMNAIRNQMNSLR